MFLQDKASFRDSCGYVFIGKNKVIRTVHRKYQEHYEHAVQSGLFATLQKEGLLFTFEEINPPPNLNHENAWKYLQSDKIPFISYAHEWSFPQLQEAALLTLKIQKIALEHGMSLKDASTYNVQFYKGKPIFIDTLSFEKRAENSPWQGYRQFCMHFLAPLALQSYEHRLSRLTALWVDGIPLDIAWDLLPTKAALAPGLQMHLHLHAKAEKKFEDARTAVKRVQEATLSTARLLELIGSLERTILALPQQKACGEWANYYEDTNYSANATQYKENLVYNVAQEIQNTLEQDCLSMAVDLGANTGKYSALLAKHFDIVIAADIDATAVGMHYQKLKDQPSNIVPLVLDLANPSPSIGWAHEERASWLTRCQASLVSALALTHHLYFTAGIPWHKQAQFFANSLQENGVLLIEFVPRNDSQVQRMLMARDNDFSDYDVDSFSQIFSEYFDEKARYAMQDSERTCIVYRKREQ